VGFCVSFVARGIRYERLSKTTFNINDRLYRIPVVHADKINEPADLVMVALKHHHLGDAVGDIAALTGENTAILSVMNGLESEKIIGGTCGMEKLVYAIAVGIDAVHEHGRFSFANPGRIVFGPSDHTTSGSRLERIHEALNRAGIDNEIPADIMRAMWWKFMLNVGINQASAVLRAPYRVFQSSADARELMQALMQEVVAIAGKAGINLTQNDLDEFLPMLKTFAPGGKTSMLQDVEAKRKTEVEIFAGKVIELGRRYGVPTPVNATIQQIIKVIESRNGVR
jgi:2-dehydropantoate 2-reductase